MSIQETNYIDRDHAEEMYANQRCEEIRAFYIERAKKLSDKELENYIQDADYNYKVDR